MKRTLWLALLAALVLVQGFAVAQEQAAEAPAAPVALGKVETITGTVSMVVPDKGTIVVNSASGVPYNFKVNRATRIKIAGQKAKLADLQGQTGKAATVKFLPLRTGNLARSVDVQ